MISDLPPPPRSGGRVSSLMTSRLLTLFDYLLFQFTEPVSELMDQVSTLSPV